MSGDQRFNQGEVQDLVEKALRSKYEKINVKVVGMKQLSNNTASGQFSDIILLDLDYESNEYELPFRMVAKIPRADILPAMLGLETELEITAVNHICLQFHNVETMTYEYLTASPIVGVPVPKFYGATPMHESNMKGGVFLLQDMTTILGAKQVPLWKGLDRCHCVSVARSLACLHAHCFQNPSFLSNCRPRQKEDYSMLPVIFQKMCANIPEEILNNDMRHHLTQYYDTYKIVQDIQLYKDILPPVLVHGDPWANNLWFDANDSLVGIIDWAEAHQGSPTSDFVRMLTNSCDAEVRKDIEDGVFHAYYDHLTELMSANVPFTLDQFKQVYKSQLQYGVATFTIEMGTFFKSPDFEGNPERLEIMVKRWIIALQDAFNASSACTTVK